ncbi:hypothetical protein KM918_24370 [Priestia megaterium]|jgi:hypothetical protein|uniref:hypothetical protein n=1 Tax=Priestia megaterium TaxID=1404 RepID=UPI001C23550D|nr:hypothetical protein [Priestia megaterium]MBU8690440.1 hypothetical protein [Priestia megaterium]
MTKTKTTIFILIIVACIAIIGYPFVKNLIKNDDPLSSNTAEQVTLSKGDNIVGKDLQPGFYDVKASSTKLSFMGIELSENDTLLGQYFDNEEHVIIEGNGNVKLSPAKFNTLSSSKGGKYLIQHSGFYIVGKQIPQGDYKLSYFTKNKKTVDTKPFIQVLPKYGGNPLQTIQFEKKENYDITLKEGNILQVSKNLFEENNNIVVELKAER